MTFTSEQIKALANPYEALGDADTLAEHQQTLEEQLSTQEKKDLAIKMVLQCPEKELNNLGHAIRALKAHGAAEGTFQHSVNKAWEIRKKIISLGDPRNTKPYELLTDSDFNDELCEYSVLASELSANAKKAIVHNLALTTPAKQRHEVARTMQNTLRGNDLGAAIGAAFAACREVEMKLLASSSQSATPKEDISAQAEAAKQMIAGKHSFFTQAPEPMAKNAENTPSAELGCSSSSS